MKKLLAALLFLSVVALLGVAPHQSAPNQGEVRLHSAHFGASGASVVTVLQGLNAQNGANRGLRAAGTYEALSDVAGVEASHAVKATAGPLTNLFCLNYSVLNWQAGGDFATLSVFEYPSGGGDATIVAAAFVTFTQEDGAGHVESLDMNVALKSDTVALGIQISAGFDALGGNNQFWMNCDLQFRQK